MFNPFCCCAKNSSYQICLGYALEGDVRSRKIDSKSNSPIVFVLLPAVSEIASPPLVLGSLESTIPDAQQSGIASSASISTHCPDSCFCFHKSMNRKQPLLYVFMHMRQNNRIRVDRYTQKHKAF